MTTQWKIAGWLTLSVLLFAGCSSNPPQDGPPTQKGDPWAAAEPVPKKLPRSRYGNPSEYVVFGKRYRVLPDATGFVQEGNASWYGQKFHGQRTSSGETFDMFALTAAHRELPIPCIAKVTNLSNGKSVMVRINDRGPFHSDRVLDLSWAAATRLGVVEQGTAPVRVQVLESVADLRGAPPPPPEFNIDGETAAAAQPRNTIALPDLGPADATRPSQYFLQVGAFRDRTKAEQSRQRFAAMGYPVAPSSPESGGWLRVWLGPWPDTSGAEAAAAELARRGLDSLLVAQ